MNTSKIMINNNGDIKIEGDSISYGNILTNSYGITSSKLVENCITPNKLANYSQCIQDTTLSEEKLLELIETFIKDNNIESDGKSVFLYKPIYEDNTGFYEEQQFTYETGKFYSMECDKDINRSNGKGIYLFSLDGAIRKGIYKPNRNSSLSGVYKNGGCISSGTITIQENPFNSIGLCYSFSSNNKITPTNPSVLNDKPEYKIIKVRVDKKNLIPIKSNELRCSQIEVLEEVEFADKLSYEILSLIEKENSFLHRVKVYNKYTDKSIVVEFENSGLIDDGEELASIIKYRIDTMQKIYNAFQKCNGEFKR